MARIDSRLTTNLVMLQKPRPDPVMPECVVICMRASTVGAGHGMKKARGLWAVVAVALGLLFGAACRNRTDDLFITRVGGG